jgi:hypothetical protein
VDFLSGCRRQVGLLSRLPCGYEKGRRAGLVSELAVVVMVEAAGGVDAKMGSPPLFHIGRSGGFGCPVEEREQVSATHDAAVAELDRLECGSARFRAGHRSVASRERVRCTLHHEVQRYGLSICRSIIDAHGGRSVAEANERRGAVFHFTLPAVQGGIMNFLQAFIHRT